MKRKRQSKGERLKKRVKEGGGRQKKAGTSTLTNENERKEDEENNRSDRKVGRKRLDGELRQEMRKGCRQK